MAVGDYCRREPASVAQDASVRDAAKRMDELAVGCLVVVDAKDRPVGLLTDRDVVLRVLRRRRNPERTAVREVMNDDIVTVRESAPLVLAIRNLRRDGVRRMPVVDDRGALTGIISADDALQLVSSQLAEVSETVRAQFPADLRGEHALGATAGE